MPPLPAAPGVIKLAIEGTAGPGHWVNVIHVRYTGGAPTPANQIALASQLYTAWNAQMGPLMPASSSLTKVAATDLSSDLGAYGEFANVEVGTRVGTVLPAASAVLISKTVSRRYRGGHPRTYLCIGVEADLADSCHWATSMTVAAQSAYATALAMIEGTEYGTTLVGNEVAVSYVDKALNPVPPYRRAIPVVLDVIGLVAQAAIAIQRARLHTS